MAAKRKAQAEAAPAKRGRPSAYSEAIADEICQRLSEGKPLAQICRSTNMPGYSTVRRWEDENEAFRAISTRARKDGTHFMADECLEIADDPEIDPQHKRIMVDTRIRLIGKWNAKEYGEKLDIQQTTRIEPVSADQMADEMRQSPALRREIEAMLAKSSEL